MSFINIAFFLSNNSSSARIAIDYILKYKKNINITLLIFDKKKSGIYESLLDYNIQKKIFSKWKDNRENICNEICKECIKYKVDYIFLSFMKMLSGNILKIFENKIINIHPSLLPSFKGMNSIEKSFYSSTKFMGCTTHFIDNEMDEGITICQGIINKSDKTYEYHQNKMFFILCLSLISTIILVTENRIKIINNKCNYLNVTYKHNYINPAPKEINLIIENLKILKKF